MDGHWLAMLQIFLTAQVSVALLVLLLWPMEEFSKLSQKILTFSSWSVAHLLTHHHYQLLIVVASDDPATFNDDEGSQHP